MEAEVVKLSEVKAKRHRDAVRGRISVLRNLQKAEKTCQPFFGHRVMIGGVLRPVAFVAASNGWGACCNETWGFRMFKFDDNPAWKRRFESQESA